MSNEDFLLGGPKEHTTVMEVRFDHCNCEQDYATMWRELERKIKQ